MSQQGQNEVGRTRTRLACQSARAPEVSERSVAEYQGGRPAREEGPPRRSVRAAAGAAATLPTRGRIHSSLSKIQSRRQLVTAQSMA